MACRDAYGCIWVSHYRQSNASSFPLMRSHSCPFDLFLACSSEPLSFLLPFSVWAKCCLQQEIEVTLGKNVCFMIKVIRGHVVKELVTNPVNGMNELVSVLPTMLFHDKRS